jgi:hypothetical protein
MGKAPYAALIVIFQTFVINFTTSTYTFHKSVCARSDLVLLQTGTVVFKL